MQGMYTSSLLLSFCTETHYDPPEHLKIYFQVLNARQDQSHGGTVYYYRHLHVVLSSPTLVCLPL